MSTTAGAEKVYPTSGGTSPAPAGGDPGGKPPKSGKGGMKLDKKTAMWGGAGAVALFAYLSTRGGPAEDEVVGTTVQPATLDTTEEDLYNSLQPELEAIQNAVRNQPAPAKPKAATPAVRLYYVKKSDLNGPDHLRNIARRFGGVSRAKLWKMNRRIIKRRRKDNKGGRKLKAGLPLAIPNKKG